MAAKRWPPLNGPYRSMIEAEAGSEAVDDGDRARFEIADCIRLPGTIVRPAGVTAEEELVRLAAEVDDQRTAAFQVATQHTDGQSRRRRNRTSRIRLCA